MSEDDRRATLEAIAFGSDARISLSDRVRAIEQLGQFATPMHERERLTPEEALKELESLAAAVPGMLAVALGPQAIEGPTEVDDLRELLTLAMEVNERLEARLVQRGRALQRLTVQRRLLPAPILLHA